MVDQLWILILKGKLVITSITEPSDPSVALGGSQPPEDRLNAGLNMRNGIRHVRDIYDFVARFTNQSCGLFDRHVPFSEAYQFFSMFKAPVGVAAGREAELSAELWSALSAASSWLKSHGRASREQNRNFWTNS
jgi:hypothetical protein